MEVGLQHLQNANIPEHIKKRMIHFMKNQVKNNLEEQENLTNKYKCIKCKDMTFILVENQAIPCECRAIREAENILKNSGISNEFANKNFENFIYNKNKQTIDAYTISRSYVKNFNSIKTSRNNSIIFMGQSGSGKSHLSFAIANSLMKYGVGVIYMGYRDCIVKLKQSIMDAAAYNKHMNRYKNAKVLLIDDLFKGNTTLSDINIIFEIINHRYFNNLPIIISTEKFAEDLLNIDEAIGSRILEMCRSFSIELRGNMLNHRIYIDEI